MGGGGWSRDSIGDRSLHSLLARSPRRFLAPCISLSALVILTLLLPWVWLRTEKDTRTLTLRE
jgi:nucleoside recognition membrane protein YjiH